MRLRTCAFALLFPVLASTACYHATVETGATPSTVEISKSFASSWIYGLVPPSTVETAAKCPDGVAKVQTKLSFLNQLVGVLTLGIYTPMSITVTCAAKSTAEARQMQPAVEVGADAGESGMTAAFAAAAEAAAVTRAPVLVRIF